MESVQIARTYRVRLSRELERVSGREMREHFRRTFEETVARLALGRIDGAEFREIADELIRDARGTAAQQDRTADGQPWATMPTDGSGRVGPFARWVFGLTAAACLVAVGLTVALVWPDRAATERPADPVPVSVVGSATGQGTPDPDAARELIIEGAWLSWQAYTECGEGPAECDAILREVNANPYGVHFFEDGSAVDPARN